MTAERAEREKSPHEIFYSRLLFHAVLDNFGVDYDPKRLTLMWFQENQLLKGLVNYYRGDIASALLKTEWLFTEMRNTDDVARGLGSRIRETMPLLKAEEEVALAKIFEKGRAAQKELKNIRDRGNVLPVSQEKALQSLIQEGQMARNYLWRANQGLVGKEATKFANLIGAGCYPGKNISSDDLFNEGNLGLSVAIKKYDWRTGNRFSTYATYWVKQSMQRCISDKGGAIRVPLHSEDKLRALAQAERELHREGKEKSLENLSDKTGLKPKVIKFLFWVRKNISVPEELDREVGDDEDGTTLMDIVGGREYQPIDDPVTMNAEAEILKKQIAQALGCLDDRKKEIIEKRYLGRPLDVDHNGNGRTHRKTSKGKDKKGTDLKLATATLEDVAQDYKLSRERIRQLEGQALEQLKSALTNLVEIS